jgi:hypothetical protein
LEFAMARALQKVAVAPDWAPSAGMAFVEHRVFTRSRSANAALQQNYARGSGIFGPAAANLLCNAEAERLLRRSER